MCDSFEDSMDMFDSDSDSLDSSNVKDATYQVKSIDEITHKMEQVIQSIVSSTEMPSSVVRIALSQHNWDTFDLLDKFYDNQEKFFEKINVLNPFQEVATTSTVTTTTNGMWQCLTCYEELPSSSFVGLSCNHMFCKDCWSQYLTVKINEGSELISCQSLKCDFVMDDPTVNQLLTDDRLKARYKRWITNNFVLSDPFLEWCPGPDCNNAIEASNTPVHNLDCVCDCGHEFCFECRSSPHEPIPCNLFKIWQSQSADANLQYMLKNTRKCPKCDCLIEKNHGCDYMYCTRCRTEFCWVCFKKCFADWRYGHGRCNTPKSERPPAFSNTIRYQRYNASYESHMKSLNDEKKIIKDKIDKSIGKSFCGVGMLDGDIKFLQRSFGIVLDCRKSLMMSYIFAFFVVESNQKAIFEENQRDLEDALNTLSQYLQIDATYDNYTEANVKVKDKAEYCDHRRLILQEHISEGLFKRSWEFQESPL